MAPATSSPAVPETQDTRTESCAAALRELLRWCLPALLLGFALRAALTWSLPYGYVQYDSSDYLVTTKELIEHHRFYIHDKRSYLTPGLFSAAFLLPVPALITIAAVQHLLGLIGTVIVGALVRLWFRFWKAVIIPITVLFAASPWIIWYEHTIMGEAQYLFFTLVMILAGTLFVQRPTMKRFAWFMVALAVVSGTRLESKTFYLFALLLVIPLFWKQWRRTAIGLTAIVATYAAAFHFSGGRDGSALVYAALIRFAPAESKSTPDIMPRIIPIQEAARKMYPDYPAKLVRLSKEINTAVEQYVTERVTGKRNQRAEEARITGHLCLETLAAEPLKTLVTPWTKFHLAIDAWSSYCFDEMSLRDRQRDAMINKTWMTETLGRGLTGEPLTLQQIPDWLRAHYSVGRVLWFTRYQAAWNKQVIHFRLPDQPMTQRRWVHDFYGGVADPHYTLPGVPFFYIVGFLGMVLSIFRPLPLRILHFAWVSTILGGLYAASMIGVTNGRFRFVYEPFFLIYLFLFFDCLAGWSRDWRRRREAAPACST